MGTNRIKDRINGQVIDDEWFNAWRRALSGDLVPRSPAGAPTDGAGSLGSSTLKWLRAFIGIGYFKCGDMKLHHSYNGLVGPGHGWMKCDGRMINEANYDAEHGAGAWDAYIGTCPIDGRYLPNFNDRFPIGAATIAEDGTSALPAVGNTGHSVSLQHNHKWHKASGSTSVSDQTHNSSGALMDYTNGATTKNGSIFSLAAMSNFGPTPPPADLYTSNSLGATSVKPDSIELQFYMRVI